MKSKLTECTEESRAPDTCVVFRYIWDVRKGDLMCGAGGCDQIILFEGLFCIETLTAPSKATGIVCNKVTVKLSQSPIVTVPLV